MRRLDRWIKDRMPESGRQNDAIFFVFKSCLASLIYHRPWLNETIHSDNSIRLSPFWYEDIPYADHVTTCFPWTRTDDTPEFTGIPLDVLYLAKIEEQNKKIAELEQRLIDDNTRVIDTINTHIDEALDARAVGGEGFCMAKTMMEKIDKLIESSEKAYNERVANATTLLLNEVDDEDDLCAGGGFGEEEVVEITAEEEAVLQEQAIDAARKEKNRQILEQRKKNRILVGYHHGIITPVLPDFR